MSAIITMSFLGFWPLAIGLFPSKKSVIVAPRNNTYYQSKCLLSWVLGGNFLASEVHDLVKKLRGREDRRERGAVIFQALTLCCYTRYILSQNRVGSEKNCIQIIRINFRNNKLKMTGEILPVIFNKSIQICCSKRFQKQSYWLRQWIRKQRQLKRQNNKLIPTMNKTTTTTRQIIILNMTMKKTTTSTKTTKQKIDFDN